MTIRKNNAVEFFRFLFVCIIFILHFRGYGKFDSQTGHFNGGYLGVEFFFIVSGYLLMGRASNDKEDANPAKKSLRYLISRYIRLYPAYLLSIIILLIYKNCSDSTFQLLTVIKKGFPDILALQIFWRPQAINGHLWFISANLWASFLVYYFVSKDKESFLYLIEPISLLVFIGATFRAHGHLDLTANDVLWISGIRAFTEIGLGCLVYQAVNALKDSHIKLNRWFCSLLEMLLLFVIILIMYRTRRDYKDYIMIFLLAVFVFFLFAKQGILSKALDNRASGFLGSISYLMYLNQALVINLVPRYLKFSFWNESLICLVVLLIIAWLETLILAICKSKRLYILNLIVDDYNQST